MKPAIAFFDFDGTITKKDTLFEIIRFKRSASAYYGGMMMLAPVMVAMKMKLLSNQAAKQLTLQYFFGNMPVAEFRERCAAFCKERLPLLIREQALLTIKDHIVQGHRVAVVTASAQDWVTPWCQTLGIECIGTQLEVVNGLVTGKIAGDNCNGEEKVRRIRQQFDLPLFGDIYAYGDTSGDRPMLGLATFGYFRKF